MKNATVQELFYTVDYFCLATEKWVRPQSLPRFVELMPATWPFLCLSMRFRMGHCTGISFVDFTRLPVCHNKRIYRHKAFAGLAAGGKSSMGWFYGFKLHLVVNEQGEILSFSITPGNGSPAVPTQPSAKHLGDVRS